MSPRGRAARRSAGFVVVRRTDAGWRYLILRAYRNWDLPKGMIEPGETPLAAARRETREETSLDDLVLRWGEDSRETVPYGRNKVARFFVAESPGAPVHLPVNTALGRPEHHAFRWVDAEDAIRLLPPRLAPIVAWARGVVEDAARS